MEQQATIEKKRWWVAGLFSFLIPGFGQLYNGQAIKGLVFYFLVFFLELKFYPTLTHHLEAPDSLTRSMVLMLMLMLCAMRLTYLLAIIDAIHSAIKAGAGRKPRFYNRLSVYASILVAAFALSFLTPDEPGVFDKIKTFKIPSGSMEPSIEAGDYLVCDLVYYRTHSPRRGDIVIFKYPRDEDIDYIKRVVGLPGDTVELRKNTLYVNEQKVDEGYTVYGGNGDGPALPPRNYGPYFISENEYFVMGDNRDNSSDSRDFGSVERDKIEGKAIFVYFSWDMKIPRWNVPGRLASIRFSRIGQVL
jgi:signal peptidase I